MLNKPVAEGKPLPRVHAPFKPGQYVVVPGKGVCVFGPAIVMSTGEGDFAVFHIRKETKPQASFYRPHDRLGIRALSTPKEIGAALQSLSGSKRGAGRRWALRTKEVEGLISKGGMEDLSEALVSLLGKYRSKDIKATNLKNIVASLGLSHSEVQLAGTCVSNMADEISVVTGSEDKAKIVDLVLASVLVPKYVPVLPKPDISPPALEVSDGEFFRIFGRTKDHAEIPDVAQAISVSNYAPRPPLPPSRKAAETLTMVSGPVEPSLHRKPMKRAGAKTAPVAFFMGYPQEIQNILRAEDGNVQKKGLLRDYMYEGANCLSPDELKIMVMTALRSRAVRLSLPDAAAQRRS